jgi:hypothetical protein
LFAVDFSNHKVSRRQCQDTFYLSDYSKKIITGKEEIVSKKANSNSFVFVNVDLIMNAIVNVIMIVIVSMRDLSRSKHSLSFMIINSQKKLFKYSQNNVTVVET